MSVFVSIVFPFHLSIRQTVGLREKWVHRIKCQRFNWNGNGNWNWKIQETETETEKAVENETETEKYFTTEIKLGCIVGRFCIVALYRSRGSVDRDKKTDNDTAIETYDNVPLDNSSTSSQNGFVSIITSNHFCLIYLHNFSFNGKDIDSDLCSSYMCNLCMDKSVIKNRRLYTFHKPYINSRNQVISWV